MGTLLPDQHHQPPWLVQHHTCKNMTSFNLHVLLFKCFSNCCWYVKSTIHYMGYFGILYHIYDIFLKIYCRGQRSTRHCNDSRFTNSCISDGKDFNGLWSCCVEPADLQWNTLLTCKLSGAIIYLGLIYPSYACKNLTICKNADIVFLHSLALCNSPVLGYNREHLWCKITRKSCSKMRWILEKFSNNN